MTDDRYSSIGGEVCQDCNRRYKINYHVPNELWYSVTGKKEGLLCPLCFDRIASIKGYTLSWEPRKHPCY